MAARANVYEGSVYMSRYLNGTWGDYQGPIESTRFSIKSNSTQLEQISRGRGTFGQVSESVSIQQPADFSVTFTEGTADVMAMGLMGTVGALSQASGTLTAVTVVGVLDAWVPLTKAGLTGTTTVTNAAASTTYVEGTDYLINRDLGLFKALGSGTIGVAAATLKLTSTYKALTGKEILGGTSSDVRVRFMLDGRNLADGALCQVLVHEAVLAAEEAVDFLSGEFINVPLTGRMKTPSGFASPFMVKMLDTA